MPIEKICPGCNKPFRVPPSRVAKYTFCSLECKRATTPRQSCVVCGKEFGIKQSKLTKGHGRYCSKACWSIRNPPTERPCLTCGKIFVARDSDTNRKYCSMPCRNVGKLLKDPTHKCVICGKIFADRKHRKRKVCSFECSGLLHWRGGYEPYYGPGWRNQRREARKRDNYTCQRCGVAESQLKKRLDVHHIVKFRHFGIARHTEANALTNLISLCKRCHKIEEEAAPPVQLRFVLP